MKTSRRTVRLSAVAVFSAVGLLASACSTTDGVAEPAEPAEHTIDAPVATSTERPAPPKVEVLPEIHKERIVYKTDPDSDPEQNWADFYLPAGPQAKDTIPLVVMVHGGGWRAPIGANVFDKVAQDLAERGMAVYNVEYRRLGQGGGYPQTFRDVAAALDYVVEVDKKYPQITTNDELVVGHSAGGQLATWAGTRHKLEDDEVGNHPKFRPTRVVSLAGPLDMRLTAKDGNNHIVGAMGGEPDEVPERWDSVDPIRNIDPSIPVAAVHGKKDTVVRPHNSVRYIDALNKAGGHGELFLYDDDDHLSIVRPGTDAYNKILDLITEYADTPIKKLEEDN